MLKTLKIFWFTSLASEMEYRANFLTSTLYSLGQLAGTLFTLNVLYSKGYQFHGWSEDQSYLVVALFTLMDGITTSALNPNLSRIVAHVQRGTLDFILLKPLDSQFQLSTRNLTPWGFPNILFALALMIYAGTRLHLPLYAYPLGILPACLAVVILYSLWFAVATTTIWFTKIWNATEVLRAFIEAGKYPMAALLGRIPVLLHVRSAGRLPHHHSRRNHARHPRPGIHPRRSRARRRPLHGLVRVLEIRPPPLHLCLELVYHHF